MCESTLCVAGRGGGDLCHSVWLPCSFQSPWPSHLGARLPFMSLGQSLPTLQCARYSPFQSLALGNIWPHPLHAPLLHFTVEAKKEAFSEEGEEEGGGRGRGEREEREGEGEERRRKKRKKGKKKAAAAFSRIHSGEGRCSFQRQFGSSGGIIKHQNPWCWQCLV